MEEEIIQGYYDFILPIVVDAGKILFEAKDVKGRAKNGVEYDFVTAFDTETENMLYNQIKAKYPSHKKKKELQQLREGCLRSSPTVCQESTQNVINNPISESTEIPISSAEPISDQTIKAGRIRPIFASDCRTYDFLSSRFIGEEESSNKEKIHLTDDPTWIIDPIDGTENFMHGLNISCISVGMTINKQQVFGIVYDPFRKELFTAIKGNGAYLNGERIKTSGQKDYKQSFFNYEISMARCGSYFYNLYMFRLKHLMPKVMGLRCLGCAVLGLCYVACGRFDAYQCDGLYTWDAAAGTLIVREAGGYVIDSSGKEFDLLDPNFLATSSKDLADQYLEIEREADEEMNNAIQNNKSFTP